MKRLAITSLALLLIGETSQAMLPGMPEQGRHIRSLPVIGTQTQEQAFKGDIITPQNGPMLAPGMPWKPPQSDGPLLAPGMPWKPPQSGSTLSPLVPQDPTAVC